MFDKKPALILSNDGIETEDSGFQSWKDVTEEEVYVPFRNDYLFYKYPGGSRNMLLSGVLFMNKLDTSPKRIAHLLYVYRNRYLQNKDAREGPKTED